MPTIRRLYLYSLSWLGLAACVFGVANLIRVGLDRAQGTIGPYLFISGPDLFRRQVAVFAAITLVALPVWLAHWLIVERSALAVGPAGDGERLAASRRAYLALVLTFIGLGPVGVGFWRLIAGMLEQHWQTTARTPINGAVATILVCGAVGLLHWQVSRRDVQLTPEVALRTGWRGFFLYGTAAVALWTLGAGVFALSDLLVRVIVAPWHAPLGSSVSPWWGVPLASGVASVLTGLSIWGALWGWSNRLAAAETAAGRAERRSGWRRLFIYAVLFVAITTTVFALAGPIESLIRLALGESRAALDRQAGDVGWGGRVAVSLLRVLFAAVVWLVYRPVAQSEEFAATIEHETARRLGELRRLYVYLVAGVGMGFLVGGLVTLVGALAQILLASNRTVLWGGPIWHVPIASGIAYALLGLAIWLPTWAGVQGRVRMGGPAERQSVVRRAYLALAAGVGIVILLWSGAIALNALFSALLGTTEDPRRIFADVAGWLMGGLILSVYHGAVFLRDRTHERATTPAPAAPATGPSVALQLIGVPGADLEIAVAALRQALPPGYRLELDGNSHLPRRDVSPPAAQG